VPDEENQIRGEFTPVDKAGANSFDELARGLAEGTISRRRALKMVGGAILGAGTLALFPGVSGAQDVTESTDATTSAIGNCPNNPNYCHSKCNNTSGRDCRCVHGWNGDSNFYNTCVRPCCSNRGCNRSSDCRSTEVYMYTACCSKGGHGVCVTKCGAKRPKYCGNGITFG
jgi:hypothetical protein